MSEQQAVEIDGSPKRRPRGFASLTPEQRREAARLGGLASQASGRAHRFTREEARAAGTKGGVVASQDREHMVEIGRRGGAAVSMDRTHMATIGRKGGKAVSANRAHMAEIGRASARARKASGS